MAGLPAPVTPFAYAALSEVLASSLQKRAASIRLRVLATTAAIIEIGRLLYEVKVQLSHGQFSQWVSAECGFSVRSAENYIRAAEFAKGKNETVSLLPPATVYKLAAKSAPTEVVNAVIERVNAGVPVSQQDVEAALADARHQKREAERKVYRKAVSKSTMARHEKLRREEEERSRKHAEQMRTAAIGIIDTIGECHARFLVETLNRTDQWEILEHLRREVSKIDDKIIGAAFPSNLESTH